MVRRLVPPEMLARRIRMAIGDQRMSVKRLSEQSGISRPSLSRKLSGQVPFTYDNVLSVIEVLGVPWEDLVLSDEEDPHGPAADLTLRLLHTTEVIAAS